MNKNICIALFLFFISITLHANAQSHAIALYRGIVIHHSVIIKNKVYHLGPAGSSSAPVIITGNNITVDFNGAVIEGSSDAENPDQFKGTGIVIKNGRNITLKNLSVRGFKVGVKADGINALTISGGNFSNNFRQRLNSTRQKEDLSDWQSYHHNEKDEWLRFGAGIYMRDCDSAAIHNDTVTEGQCGLMMTHCNKGLVYNNNFSFNSGIGIGMYRSCANRILYNKLDWNIRGFSYGVYYRGQDSAGILVFEQCSDNVFAWNSVTHSGDGFFLWAGQSTMDTGKGGCNDNLVFSNDFSYAATNGVEITFSRNKIINNVIHDCWHGIWGGFSYNTVIANNDFANNLSAIAIEHGSDNTIAQNKFVDDKAGVELWSNPGRPKDFGYLQKRDTRSMNYHIDNNTFTGVKNVFNINNTIEVNTSNNRASGSTLQQKLDSTVKNISFDKTGDQVNPVTDSSYFPHLTEMADGQNTRLTTGRLKGKKYIMMTEWGPYSFSYPILWKEKTDSTGKMYFDMIGPNGKWRMVHLKGATNPSAMSGTFNGELVVQKDTGALTNIDIEVEYRGDKVVSPTGIQYKKDQPYIFHYREFDIPIQWQMKWFAFDTTSDPLKDSTQFKRLIAGTPVKLTAGNDLGNVFAKGFGKNIPTKKIATLSTANITVPDGLYRIGISASEMVRVYIDDKLIIENWDPAKIVYDADYHRDAIISLKGTHKVRIEQAQYGDYGMLNFTIQPVFDDLNM